VSGERHARVKAIFVEACGLPPDERPAFVIEACGGDGELQREVESLLAHHREGEGDSTPPSPSIAERDRPTTAPSDAPTERIGPYRLLEKIGEGGMGEVYVAEQEEPVRRRVAIKLIKLGLDSREVVARFEAERQALALMNHRNIARVFDAGATERGRPYFVMEYVEGEPITAYCDRQCFGMRQRLDLFLQICEGVQHAHQKGVVHRDIKPSNVLIHIENDEPVPKIIDFGVAKATQQRLTEKTMYTARGMLIGTPEYMSPEQAELTGLDVDTRTDIYALGVLLYEMLVGVLPFDPSELREAGFDEIRRKIREDEPSKPSTRFSTLGEASTEMARLRRTDPQSLGRTLRGDLDWITMKALEKDRTRRYASASDVAADIRRHLQHEPVLAGPPGAGYRLRKFIRRHRVGTAAVAAVCLALVIGIAGTTVGFVRAKQEAERARKVAGFLEQMLNDLNPGTQNGHARTPDEIIDRAVRRIETELADEPLIQARLMRTVGQTSNWLGSYDRARSLLERAVEIEREHRGPDHPDVAMALGRLGELLYNVGDYDEAQRIQEEALELRQRVLGPRHVLVTWSLTALGSVHWRKAEFEQARSYLEQSVEILEDVQGLRRVDLASTLMLLAMLEMDLANYRVAQEHLERALEIKEGLLGPDHPEVGIIVRELGRALEIGGDVDAARGNYERALTILETELGPEHPSVAFPLSSLGSLAAESGDHERARALLERSLKIREEALGPRHPNLVWSLVPLGRLLFETGDFDGARRTLERALEIVEQAFGADHPEASWVLEALGDLESRRRDLDESRRE
jgi:serine/threonine protein kinase